MKIPQSGRRKALILVDFQKGFMPQDNSAFENTKKLLAQATYDLYVTAVFHTETGSLRDKQMAWTFPKESEGYENMILPFLHDSKPLITIEKTTKSCFK